MYLYYLLQNFNYLHWMGIAISAKDCTFFVVPAPKNSTEKKYLYPGDQGLLASV